MRGNTEIISGEQAPILMPNHASGFSIRQRPVRGSPGAAGLPTAELAAGEGRGQGRGQRAAELPPPCYVVIQSVSPYLVRREPRVVMNNCHRRGRPLAATPVRSNHPLDFLRGFSAKVSLLLRSTLTCDAEEAMRRRPGTTHRARHLLAGIKKREARLMDGQRNDQGHAVAHQRLLFPSCPELVAFRYLTSPSREPWDLPRCPSHAPGQRYAAPRD